MSERAAKETDVCHSDSEPPGPCYTKDPNVVACVGKAYVFVGLKCKAVLHLHTSAAADETVDSTTAVKNDAESLT